MDKLVKLMGATPKTIRHDDDFVDRLHHLYTVTLIVVCTVLLGMRQWLGNPITCWAPKHFTGSHTKFATNLCWVNNTYFLDMEEEIPKEHEAEKRQEIFYYQWITFILLGQAMFFFLPHLVWRIFNSKSGIDSDDILAAADKYNQAHGDDDRKKKLAMLISNQLHRFVTNPSSNGTSGFSLSALLAKVCCVCGRRFGNYLNILYMLTKFLYIGNVVVQLLLIGRLLQADFASLGIALVKNYLNGERSIDERIFPHVTMCDFHMRVLGNVQRYTIQCVLPLNLYIEAVYVVIWFWMMFVLCCSILSFLQYILRMALTDDRLRFIRGHLKLAGRQDTARERQLAKEFVNYYLKQDGVFILRMVAHNTNKLTTNELITACWDNWCESRPDLIEPTSDLGGADTLPLCKLEKDGAPRPRGNPPPTTPKRPAPPPPPIPSAPTLDQVDHVNEA